MTAMSISAAINRRCRMFVFGAAMGAVMMAAPAGAGAAPEWPSPAALELQTHDALAAKYGALFTDARVSYVSCPAQLARIDKYDGNIQDCQYEFGDRTRRRAGSVEYIEDADTGLPVARTAYGTVYSLTPRSCGEMRGNFRDRSWSLRSLKTAGDSLENACGAAALVVDRLAASRPYRSTLRRTQKVRVDNGQKGYTALTDWTCKTRGRETQTVKCTTTLGHTIEATLRRSSARRP